MAARGAVGRSVSDALEAVAGGGRRLRPGRVTGAAAPARRTVRRSARNPAPAAASASTAPAPQPHAAVAVAPRRSRTASPSRAASAAAVTALAGARQAVRASGPWPADTVFVRAVRGEFDAVVACYHDQGLIPVKLLAFGQAVNVTIGLPIIRTSVDHGTAFDIAGRGVADHGSLVAAVRLAARLAGARR